MSAMSWTSLTIWIPINKKGNVEYMVQCIVIVIAVLRSIQKFNNQNLSAMFLEVRPYGNRNYMESCIDFTHTYILVMIFFNKIKIVLVIALGQIEYMLQQGST